MPLVVLKKRKKVRLKAAIKGYFFFNQCGKKWVMKKIFNFEAGKKIIVFHVQRCLKPSKSFLNATQVLKWRFGWKKNQFPLSLIIMPTQW